MIRMGVESTWLLSGGACSFALRVALLLGCAFLSGCGHSQVAGGAAVPLVGKTWSLQCGAQDSGCITTMLMRGTRLYCAGRISTNDHLRAKSASPAGLMVSVDSHSGEILWRTAVGADWLSRPVFSSDSPDDPSMFGLDYDGNLWSLDVSTGHTNWIAPSGLDHVANLRTALCADGEVLIWGRRLMTNPDVGDDLAAAFDAEKGRRLWARRVNMSGFGTVIPGLHRLILSEERNRLIVLDYRTGSLDREVDIGEGVLGLQRVASDVLVFSLSGIKRLKGATLKPSWSIPLGLRPRPPVLANGFPALQAGNVLVVMVSPTVMLGVDLTDGRVKWHQRLSLPADKRVFFVLDQEVVYGTGKDCENPEAMVLHRLNTATGEPQGTAFVDPVFAYSVVPTADSSVIVLRSADKIEKVSLHWVDRN